MEGVTSTGELRLAEPRKRFMVQGLNHNKDTGRALTHLLFGNVGPRM